MYIHKHCIHCIQHVQVYMYLVYACTALVQIQWAPLSVVLVYSSALSPGNLCLPVLQVRPLLWLPPVCYSQEGANVHYVQYVLYIYTMYICTMYIILCVSYTIGSTVEPLHWGRTGTIVNLELAENHWEYSKTSPLGTHLDKRQLEMCRKPLEIQ